MTETQKALNKMKTIRKIMDSKLDDLSAYYILKWYETGWRDEEWVKSEIKYRLEYPIEEVH